MLGEMKDKFCLKDMVKFFIKTQPDVKKFWKKKSKDLTKKYELENVHEEESKNSESEEKTKNSKNSKNSQLLNKKQKRKNESDDSDEEKSEKVEKTKNKNKNGKIAKKEEIQEISDNEFIPRNPIKKNGIVEKEEKIPFTRINNALKEVLPETLKDNSYDNFMYKTGENYGKQANEKLKFTKGRDFKKEKTKYKNKTAFGGMNISMAVRSIKLDDD